MRGRPGLGLVAAALLLGPGAAGATGLGEGYGENLRPLVSARQAGTGGVGLEDYWLRGAIVELTSITLTPDWRWFVVHYQENLIDAVRLGLEVYYFRPPDSPRSSETAYGTYQAVGGEVGTREYGLRSSGQMLLQQTRNWRIDFLTQGTLAVQRLPGDTENMGSGLEAGGQVRWFPKAGRALMVWGLFGPIGRGAGHAFSRQVSAGAGGLFALGRGLLGMPGGYGVTAEGRYLGESLVHGGAGAVYWFGQPTKRGTSFFIRAGGWYGPESAQTIQPRAGLGVLFRQGPGLGVNFDYAVVPIGELGFYHYASIGVRLATLGGKSTPEVEVPAEMRAKKPRKARPPDPMEAPPPPPSVPAPQPVEVPAPPPPPAPAPVQPPPPDARSVPAAPPPEVKKWRRWQEEIFYFYPEVGEKAFFEIEVGRRSTFGVSLLDADGHFVRRLIEPQTVAPGTYLVEWDGTVQGGLMARYELPYFLQITADDQTIYRRAVARQKR